MSACCFGPARARTGGSPATGPAARQRGSVVDVTRIVAGRWGGRRLATPVGGRTRPTSDRVREALFNTIGALTELAGARFADLYAGSGAVGLEALSRGAAHVLLVESDRRAGQAARENLSRLGTGSAVQLVVARVPGVLAGGAGPDGPYDVVFADPPYALPERDLTAMQQALLAGGWLASEALLVIERASRSSPVQWVTPVTEIRVRRYGETTLWYGRRS